MAKTLEQRKSAPGEELEFKSAFVHAQWMVEKSGQGFHHPKAHTDNVYEVCPPPQADGKTYCPKCHLCMVPYSKLSEEDKNLDRAIVRNFAKADLAWQDYLKGEKIVLPGEKP